MNPEITTGTHVQRNYEHEMFFYNVRTLEVYRLVSMLSVLFKQGDVKTVIMKPWR